MSVGEMSSWNFSVDKNKGQSIFLKLLFAILLTRSSVPVLNRRKICRWPHLKNTWANSTGLLNILNKKKVIYFLIVRSHFTRLIFYARHPLYWMGPTNMRQNQMEWPKNGLREKVPELIPARSGCFLSGPHLFMEDLYKACKPWFSTQTKLKNYHS